MKVLHVITGLDAGGAELQLAMILRRTRHDSDVVTLYNPGPVAEQIEAQGTSVRNLGMRSNTELRALLRLRKIISDGRYDVVHTHLYRAQIYARPAARLAGTPVVLTTEHSIGETHIERRKMTSGVRGAVPGLRAVLRRHHRRVRHRQGPPGEVGRAARQDHRDPQRGGHRRARVRPGRAGTGPRAVRHLPGHVRDRRARPPRPEQARRPDDGGGRAAAGRAVQDPGDRPRRGPGPAGGGGRAARRDRARDLRRLPVRHHRDAGRLRPLRRRLACRRRSGCPCSRPWPAGCRCCTPPARPWTASRPSGPGMVPGTAEALGDEIRKEFDTGPRPRVADSKVFDRYGIESVVSRIDDLYEQVLAGRPRRVQRKAARRRPSAAPRPSGVGGRGRRRSAAGPGAGRERRELTRVT